MFSDVAGWLAGLYVVGDPPVQRGLYAGHPEVGFQSLLPWKNWGGLCGWVHVHAYAHICGGQRSTLGLL